MRARASMRYAREGDTAHARPNIQVRRRSRRSARRHGRCTPVEQVTPIRQLQMGRFNGKSWELFGDVLGE
ncbi:hypothetical protein KUL72_07705 [Bradyrhizobium arachidis]|uniref:hypothetical protein n=2 Tax=Bradyrhizobium TaxID=374 RepID=UPI0021631BDA|nr:hypothetical protein [Bradyrhizobium arachidis]UVO40733.1 hypothetical protein KUL72_07705 [Bradyrhizobium arachidis]